MGARLADDSTEPLPHTEVRAGELAIRGVAWSGVAPMARVEVSVNDGDWREARLVSAVYALTLIDASDDWNIQ